MIINLEKNIKVKMMMDEVNFEIPLTSRIKRDQIGDGEDFESYVNNFTYDCQVQQSKTSSDFDYLLNQFYEFFNDDGLEKSQEVKDKIEAFRNDALAKDDGNVLFEAFVNDDKAALFECQGGKTGDHLIIRFGPKGAVSKWNTCNAASIKKDIIKKMFEDKYKEDSTKKEMIAQLNKKSDLKKSRKTKVQGLEEREESASTKEGEAPNDSSQMFWMNYRIIFQLKKIPLDIQIATSSLALSKEVCFSIKLAYETKLKAIKDERIKKLNDLLLKKKQIIFYGPPGTSKTFLAEALAEKVDSIKKPEIVQFHPSYDYEDFVEGIDTSFSGNQIQFFAKPKIFRNICADAAKKARVLIIDEINRGDLSRIFGELISRLELSYRGKNITTPLTGKKTEQGTLSPLNIPNNLFIIGTMNSADRSIALVDYALRRRFYFYEFKPEPELLYYYLLNKGLSYYETNRILYFFIMINQIIWPDAEMSKLIKIEKEKLEKRMELGKQYRLGHTLFMVDKFSDFNDEWMYSIRPLLEEYYNSDGSKLIIFDKLKKKIFDEDGWMDELRRLSDIGDQGLVLL